MRQEIDVFEDLRRRLTRGEFEHGSKLRAESLRETYNCAASTIREALFRPSTMGLVEFQEQRGFRVPEFSSDKQHDIASMRIMLESEGACKSMQYGGVDWEARLIAAHHKLSHIESRMSGMGVAGDLLQLWSDAELEFHQTLISSCGSDVLMELHLTVYYRYRQIKVEADQVLTDLAANIEEHKRIVDAAIGGDQTVMRRRIFEHFKRHLMPNSPQPNSLAS